MRTFRRKSLEGNAVSKWLQTATYLIFIIATFVRLMLYNSYELPDTAVI